MSHFYSLLLMMSSRARTKSFGGFLDEMMCLESWWKPLHGHTKQKKIEKLNWDVIFLKLNNITGSANITWFFLCMVYFPYIHWKMDLTAPLLCKSLWNFMWFHYFPCLRHNYIELGYNCKVSKSHFCHFAFLSLLTISYPLCTFSRQEVDVNPLMLCQ